MSFIKTTLRYLALVNSLISVGCAAHHFPFGCSANELNGSIKRVVSSAIKPRFAQATHPLAISMLAKNPNLFKVLCSKCFMQPVPLVLTQAQWFPYVMDPNNGFLEFASLHPNSTSIEVQITSTNVWSNISTFNKAPRSDSFRGLNTFAYNLTTNPNCKLDRTIVFSHHEGEAVRLPSILAVTQMGLGSDRLQSSKDPETKAWIEFLTKAHLKQDIPAQTPDNVAAAYKMIELKSWSDESYKHYSDILTPQKPLTQKELEEIIGIIDFCLVKQYPPATMVKYSGLSVEEIIRIVMLLTSER